MRKSKKKGVGTIKQKIVSILKKNGVKKAGIFGSFARGEEGTKSDVDIVIQPPKNMGYRFFGIAEELEEKLGRNVDLCTYSSIHPLIKDEVLEQEIRII